MKCYRFFFLCLSALRYSSSWLLIIVYNKINIEHNDDQLNWRTFSMSSIRLGSLFSMIQGWFSRVSVEARSLSFLTRLNIKWYVPSFEKVCHCWRKLACRQFRRRALQYFQACFEIVDFCSGSISIWIFRGGQFIHYNANTPNITCIGILLAIGRQHLRAPIIFVYLHIRNWSDNRFSCRMLNTLANSKICDFNISFAVDENILRFDISVDWFSDSVDIVQS